MSCPRCQNKGYLEFIYHRNNRENTSVAMCPDCKDIKAYSAHVQTLRGTVAKSEDIEACNIEEAEPKLAQVLPFIRKPKKETSI